MLRVAEAVVMDRTFRTEINYHKLGPSDFLPVTRAPGDKAPQLSQKYFGGNPTSDASELLVEVL